MPLLIMLAILGVWSYFALCERQPSYYLCMFFAGILLTALAEPVVALLLNCYDWRLGVFKAFLPDRAAGSLVIGFFLDPLLGVLFAHYSEHWPVPKAAASAIILGFFEIWLVRHGYIIYRNWHPLYTMLSFFTYFLVMRWISRRPWPMPHWLHVYGFSIFLLYFCDVSMQGGLQLWHFNVGRWNWERLFSLTLHAVAPAPVATVIAVTPLARRWWLWDAILVAGLGAVELWLRAAGWMEFGWVGLILILTGIFITIGLTVRYSAWLRRHEPAKAPPPWEPPIQLR